MAPTWSWRRSAMPWRHSGARSNPWTMSPSSASAGIAPDAGADARPRGISMTETIDRAFRDLDGRIAGDVVLPDDAAWATAKHAWNLAVDQRPVAIVYPESADDVAATVRF